MKLSPSSSRIHRSTARWTARTIALGLAGAGLGLLAGCSADTGSATESTGTAESALASQRLVQPTAKTKFFVPPPPDAAVQQVIHLVTKGQLKNALLVADMLAHPSATWFTGGTPSQVQGSVHKTMALAALDRSVPVLVAYDLPFRDCGGYSAGGALDTPSYEAWIDSFAAGIGGGAATVILEPDGLGIIPYNTTIYNTPESCQPDLTASGLTAAQANQARYDQLSYAITSLATHAPRAKVYLDGTHAAWLGVGEAAFRLNKVGVANAAGFFLNVSNFQTTANSTTFGTWVSDCIAAATVGASWAIGHFEYCPSQYNQATGFTVDYSDAYAATVTASLQNMLNGAVATTHFVVDTSRNGQGTLNAAPYAAAPYDQSAGVIGTLNAGNWCNPPGAGLGIAATTATGVPLADAYLWVKTPGESDGQCDSAGGARAWDYSLYNPWNVDSAGQAQFDPLWGMIDPAAGAWFGAQALQLAQDASPPLL